MGTGTPPHRPPLDGGGGFWIGTGHHSSIGCHFHGHPCPIEVPCRGMPRNSVLTDKPPVTLRLPTPLGTALVIPEEGGDQPQPRCPPQCDMFVPQEAPSIDRTRPSVKCLSVTERKRRRFSDRGGGRRRWGWVLYWRIAHRRHWSLRSGYSGGNSVVLQTTICPAGGTEPLRRGAGGKWGERTP